MSTVLRHRDLRLLFGALVEDARSRLARTHPTRGLSYEPPTPAAPVRGA